MRTTPLIVSTLAALAVGSSAVAQVTPGTAPNTFVGPSSSQTPYVVPTGDGWATASLISVGDGAKDNAYQMVGIPDGLGAVAGKEEEGRYVAQNRYMTVFMNHEIPGGLGVARAHGQNGAFVSQWTIHLDSLQVRRGQDLIKNVYTWDTVNHEYVFAPTAAFSRLCSADLPAATAFFNPWTGKGYNGRLFMDGEEIGDEGRGFAHVVTGPLKGTSFELADLGRFSWENNVAHPNSGDKTIVIGLDDSTPGQVYMYVGTKRRTGNPVERAGLVGGKLFGIKVVDGGANYGNGPVLREYNGPINGEFVLQEITDPTYVGSGAKLQSTSVSLGVTEFARPEDGAWDTQNPRVFYFVITGANIRQFATPADSTNPAFPQSAKLYKLTFNSIRNPTGGRIELIVDRAGLTPSTPTFAQFDNITVAGDGSVMVQEDPGNTPYIARTWHVNPGTKTATEILQADSERFGAPPLPPFNQDEESSGIIEVTRLVREAKWYEHGRRYFLADLQAHYPNTTELVEGGQLYMIASPKPPRDDGDDGQGDSGGEQ